MLLRRCVASRLFSIPRPRVRFLATARRPDSLFSPLDVFGERHIGPDDVETSKMLSQLGYKSMDAFIGDTVPRKIRISSEVINNETIPALSESQLLARAKDLGALNKPYKSYIGMGYHCAVVPPVILRNVRIFFAVPFFPSLMRFVGHREPTVVHTIYSVPTRGSSGSVATLVNICLNTHDISLA